MDFSFDSALPASAGLDLVWTAIFSIEGRLKPHFRPEEGDITIEDEYDALNNETFGDIQAEGGDWEPEEAEYDAIISRGKGDLSDEGVALEASISQLVDDDDSIIGARPVPINFSQAFRKVSPPPPMFGSDVSGSPIGKSIWASDDIPRVQKPPPGLANLSMSQKLVGETKGGIQTLEDLERELLEESRKASVMPQRPALGTRIRSAEELEKELFMGGETLPRVPPPGLVGPWSSAQQRPPLLPPYPPDILRQLGTTPEGLPNVPPPGVGGMMSFPHGFPPPHMMPPPNLLHQHIMTQQYQRALHEQERMNGRQHSQRPRYDSTGYDEYNEEDEYENLMSRREKQWLINLINSQHVSDNPYVDDYYNTIYRLRQQKRQREKELRQQIERQKHEEPKIENGSTSNTERREPSSDYSAGRVILPENKNKTDSRNYAPLQFANSLGRLQCVTVAAPRRLIDVNMSSSVAVHETTGQKESRRHKQLLLDIERLFINVFALEDWNKLVEIPLTGNTAHHEQLSVAFASPERLISILSIRKGKDLVARACAFLPVDQRSRILNSVFVNMESLFRKDQSDPMVQRLVAVLYREILSRTSLSALLKIAESVQSSSSMTGVLSNKIGCSICLGLISHGDVLRSAESDDSTLARWNAFVLDVSERLTSVGDVTSVSNFSLAAFTHAGVPSSHIEVLEKKFSQLVC